MRPRPALVAARRGQRRPLATFEAAREAMARSREPPHPYQQRRSTFASQLESIVVAAASPARRRRRFCCRAAVDKDIAWIKAGEDADAGH